MVTSYIEKETEASLTAAALKGYFKLGRLDKKNGMVVTPELLKDLTTEERTEYLAGYQGWRPKTRRRSCMTQYRRCDGKRSEKC